MANEQLVIPERWREKYKLALAIAEIRESLPATETPSLAAEVTAVWAKESVMLIEEVARLEAELAEARKAAEKAANWFEDQAARHEAATVDCRFESLNEARRADARNYRAMAKHLRKPLAAPGKD